MGLSYSTENSNPQVSRSSEINDINNKVKRIIESDHISKVNDSDTLADITEIRKLLKQTGGSADEISEAISKQYKFEKYDINNIMGRIQNQVINAGIEEPLFGGADKSDTKSEAVVTSIIGPDTVNGDNTTEKSETPTVPNTSDNSNPPDTSDNSKTPDNSDNSNPPVPNTSDNSDNSEESSMGISTDTNDRLEKKILKSIFATQSGGGYSDSSSSSSSSSEDFKGRVRHSKSNRNNNKGKSSHRKPRRDESEATDSSLDKMAKGMKQIEKDISKEKSDETQHSSSDSEITEIISEDTSNGESGNGLSIFPFDSESNSHQNYRMLRRSV